MSETLNCPGCGQPLKAEARFCSGCGLSTTLPSQETVLDAAQTPAAADATREPDPLAGRVLDGRYELVSRLGEGGMGAVYRARRLHIGDEVAVKVLHQKLVLEGEAVERFRREARSAALISHPNVVTIHDFSEARADGTPAYIVMELVRGASLREILKREGRLQPERAVALMRDVCAGVGTAHRLGFIHRDLKPDNVIVVPPRVEGEPETAKVVDFGIAKLRDLAAELRLTQTGAVVGTPYYMSPEQCRDEDLDARSDVYSLGAMLYEMLDGSPPFRANSLPGLISKHLNEEPPAIAPGHGIPPALEAVCRRALSKNPDERPADATALSRELQAALASPASSSSAVFSSSTSPPAHDPASGLATQRAVPATPPTLGFMPPQQRPAQAEGQKPDRVKWAALLLLTLLAGAGVTATAIWLMRDATPEQGSGASSLKGADEGGAASGEESRAAQDEGGGAKSSDARDLRGQWAGTYGPLGSPATLVIKEHKGGKLSGVLEQGGTRVAFEGSVDPASRRVTLRETRVLEGSGWSLGQSTGELSADGLTMSGTGRDAIGSQLGMSYEWSFSKR